MENKIDPKTLITIHACERYIERIMEIPVNEGSLNKKKLAGITNLIIRIAKDTHPNCFKSGEGSFTCSKYDCVLVLKEGVIVTIKKIEEPIHRDFAGGILNGGTKNKKLLAKFKQREKDKYGY